MSRFDFTPYRRSTVGFDRLFDVLENQARGNGGDNYPPFNIEKLGSDDDYRITLAVAGFKHGRSGHYRAAEPADRRSRARSRDDACRAARFLHVGIAQRGFERRFELADYVKRQKAPISKMACW